MEREKKMSNVIEVEGLCKRYDGFAIENLNLSIPQGGIMGFGSLAKIIRRMSRRSSRILELCLMRWDIMRL